MTTKKTKWVPYVGDDGSYAEGLRARANVPTPPDNFKTACCVCGDAYAPFGVGYPAKPRWFCRQHVGEVMPEVQENMVKVKLDQVRRKCPLGAKLWLDLMISADNGDLDGCRGIWKRIRDLSVETSDLLKSLNSEGQAK